MTTLAVNENGHDNAAQAQLLDRTNPSIFSTKLHELYAINQFESPDLLALYRALTDFAEAEWVLFNVEDQVKAVPARIQPTLREFLRQSHFAGIRDESVTEIKDLVEKIIGERVSHRVVKLFQAVAFGYAVIGPPGEPWESEIFEDYFEDRADLLERKTRQI